MDNQNEVLYSSLPRRIKAGIIDGVILLALFTLCPVIIGKLMGSNSRINGLVMFIPPLLLEPFLISYLGFTVGQYVFGIRVLRSDTGKNCPLITSFARYYIKILLGGFSMVYMLFSKKHQAIHDHVAKTIVVLSETRIYKNPEFAEHGEREQNFEGDYIYPSSIRRFGFFLIWLIPVFIGYGLIIEGIALLILPGYTLETEKLPHEIEYASDIIGSIIFIALAVVAAKGYLPGAKRKKLESKVPEQ
jgi:uncharacterized RDD family membrane protein YckC